MNQGPTTPTADPTKFNVTRIGDFAIRVGFDGAAISFVAGDTHDAQLAVLALGKALEAGRAQGRAEARAQARAEAPAKPNITTMGQRIHIENVGSFFCASQDEARHAARLVENLFRSSLEKVQVTTGPVSAAEIVANFEAARKIAEPTSKHLEALAAAQNTIAALRDDAKTDEIKIAALEADIRRLSDERNHLFVQKRELETSLVAARDARAEMQRRALDAEAVLDAVRDALDLHPNDSLLNAIDALKDENEDGGDALTKARDEAELAVLEAVKFAAVHQDAQSMSFAAQAFAALRAAG